ncbi:MAG: hypothetical protein U0R17_05800 [Acidimicrobiia bacterium]
MPSGASFPLQINIQTGQGFTSNQTEVYGVVLAGNLSEPDSYEFAYEFQMGRDGFALYSNNIMHLVYDNNELQVTINRCPGTGEEINVDDACFNVEFSKPIWAPSFDQSDLILDGGGNVYSFVQNSSTEWTIRINGMTAGGTLRVRLGQASVSDYSAIQNGASVLGENVVRYAATDSNSTSEGSSNSGVSTGTTGSHSGNSLTALTNSSTSGATTLTPSIGTISGLMSEIPEVAKSVLNPNHLLLGSWSFTKSNILDFSFILVNMSGIMAAILIFANRRRIKALRNS